MRLSDSFFCAIFLLLLLFSVQSFSQIKYEKGYYIDTNGNRTNCLIRNTDWRTNPSSFRIRQTEQAADQKRTIDDVIEFGIDGIVKFLRADVEIDQSSDVVNDMSTEQDPLYKKKRIFLNVLVEGEASLYKYIDGDSKRFFYSLHRGLIEQLIYKRYITDNVILTNNTYRKQLWENVQCRFANISTVEKLKYKESDLRDYFLAYNRCKGKPVLDLNKRQERDRFRLKLALGVNRSTLSVENALFTTRNATFDPQYGFRMGMELEYVLPFNKNKWGLLLESSYQYFNGEEVLPNETVKLNFKSLEFPLGLRYYAFLSDKAKLFFNAHYIPSYSLNFNSMVTYRKSDPLEVLPKSSFALGLGASVRNFSVELRAYPKRELLGSYLYWSGNYQRISFLLGYTLINYKR